MIEDKELGFKVAENQEDAIWETVRREAEQLIKQSENNLIVQKAMKELAEGKLLLISGKNSNA
jgi:hypothetical protein